MSIVSSPSRTLSNSQIAVAAESFVAAQFALCGFDVLEQAGRARFVYDLGVAKAGGMMKLSVHASFNGFWDLVDRYLEPAQHKTLTTADYHRAVDQWLEHRSTKVICCLVEFESADLNCMPRIYLAPAVEVAAAMHQKIEHLACEELGDLGLDIVHRVQSLSASWRFSQGRIAELMKKPEDEAAAVSRDSAAPGFPEHAAAALTSGMQISMVN